MAKALWTIPDVPPIITEQVTPGQCHHSQEGKEKHIKEAIKFIFQM